MSLKIDAPVAISVILGVAVCVAVLPGPITVFAALAALPIVVGSVRWRPFADMDQGRRDLLIVGWILLGAGGFAVVLPQPLGAIGGLVGMAGAMLAFLNGPSTQQRQLVALFAGGLVSLHVLALLPRGASPAAALVGLGIGVAMFIAARKPPEEFVRTFLLITCGALIFVALHLVLLPSSTPHSRHHCKNNLKQLALAMILYRDNQGRAEHFPTYDGSDYLLALYITEVTTEPDLFLCSITGDGNDDGAAIRFGNTLATSYAGRRNRDPSRYPGLFTTRGASETVVASDDSEGAEPFNGHGACIMLFADGHVEERDLDGPGLRGVVEVGRPGTLLEPLAN